MTGFDVKFRRPGGALLLVIVATVSMFVLHPRLGVRDVDGYAYIIGAQSFHRGNGYRSLTGEALNHWPPGYSLLLSAFPDSIRAAQIVNYLSFGVAVGLIYYLLRNAGWSLPAALGLSVALASGFFRLLSSEAHADVLTYALFLAALWGATRSPQSRFFPALIWALLIPVKLIAVVFLPASLVADCITSGLHLRKVVGSYAPAATAAVVAIASVLVFDQLTTGALMPSHEHSSLQTFVSGARIAAISIPREFLFNWHGSTGAPFPRIAFPACLCFAVACLLSLRPEPEGKWLRIYGGACLTRSALLLCVRSSAGISSKGVG
jgi:hypothetical protein